MDVVNKKAKKEQERLNRERDKRASKDRRVIRMILATEEGREFLHALLEECLVFRSTFVSSSQSYFNEGKRSIGLKFWNLINDADSTAYLKMVNEQKERKGENDD